MRLQNKEGNSLLSKALKESIYLNNSDADILKRAYLCQVSDTGSPEPLVYLCLEI
jgi:hypothetical protein